MTLNFNLKQDYCQSDYPHHNCHLVGERGNVQEFPRNNMNEH